VAVLALGTGLTASCEWTAPDPPPPPVRWAAPPPPPGHGDFALYSFDHPLTLRNAEAVLTYTRIFGPGRPWARQVQAFNVVLDEPDASARFQRVARSAQPAGKLYALAALRLLDPSAAEPVRAALAADTAEILVLEGDTVRRESPGILADEIARQQMGEAFRRVRDETNDHFARQPRRLPWMPVDILHDVEFEIRRSEGVADPLADARILMWRVEEDPERRLVVEEVVLWARLVSGPSGYALVHAFRHPWEDNRWRRSLSFVERAPGSAWPHTILGFRRFTAPPDGNAVCAFIRLVRGPVRSTGFRHVAGDFPVDAWWDRVGGPPPCGFAGAVADRQRPAL
jgi:hypothetical protein